MLTRFHVRGTGVKTVDVDPQYQAVANQTNIEFALYGYLLQGELSPGMFANIRPHLRRGKYYRVMSVEKLDPQTEILGQMKIPESLKRDILALDAFSKTTYTLHLICADRNEFEELVKMDIKDEDIELFEDAE